MGQEQKPFEIRTVFSGLCKSLLSDVLDYVPKANAEIRRLQGENRRLIKQSSRVAPTWGEWVIGNICNLSAAKCGLYEVEMLDGSRWGLYKCDLENSDICRIGWIAENGELVCKELLQKIKQFRRLNYEPQPAREVEKTYRDYGTENKISLEGLIEKYPESTWADVARDLLAAQAELRELKGASDAESK